MDDRETFRLLFWRACIPLFALPVLAGFFAASPAVEGWTWRTWVVAAIPVGAGIAFYFYRTWRRSDVVLDDAGMTLYLSAGRQTWPFEKLLKVKQIGKYRVRMCWDPDIPDTHMHISIDLVRSDAFVDALLDWYEGAVGHELVDEHAEADRAVDDTQDEHQAA